MMALHDLPDDVRREWLAARDHLPGYLVHLGQRLVETNRRGHPDSTAHQPAEIRFAARDNGLLDVTYILPHGAVGMDESWTMRGVMGSSQDLRVLSERISPDVHAHDDGGITLTLHLPEPATQAQLSEFLHAALSCFCVKDVSIQVNGHVVPPAYDEWEPNTARGTGDDRSIAVVNGIPVATAPAARGQGAVLFSSASGDQMPKHGMASWPDLGTASPPQMIQGLGAIRTTSDPLTIESRLASWGLGALREVDQAFFDRLGSGAMAAPGHRVDDFIAECITAERAYAIPDIHLRGVVLPEGPMAADLADLVDQWGQAARQAAMAAGLDQVRIGLRTGSPSWEKSADPDEGETPILFASLDTTQAPRQMLATAAYLISGYKEDEARRLGQPFDRAQELATLFAAIEPDDRYVALRKTLRDNMAADRPFALPASVPDPSGVIQAFTGPILAWNWPPAAAPAAEMVLNAAAPAPHEPGITRGADVGMDQAAHPLTDALVEEGAVSRDHQEDALDHEDGQSRVPDYGMSDDGFATFDIDGLEDGLEGDERHVPQDGIAHPDAEIQDVASGRHEPPHPDGWDAPGLDAPEMSDDMHGFWSAFDAVSETVSEERAPVMLSREEHLAPSAQEVDRHADPDDRNTIAAISQDDDMAPDDAGLDLEDIGGFWGDLGGDDFTSEISAEAGQPGDGANRPDESRRTPSPF